MSRTVRAVMVAVLLLLGDEAARAEDLLSQMRPEEFLAIPMTLNTSLDRVALTLPAYGFLALKSIDGQLKINVRAAADLADLQRRIGAIVDAIGLPTDNCANRPGENIVAKVFGREITIDGGVATLKLNGEIEVWDCRDLLFFSPAKNMLFKASFDSDLPFFVEIVDPQTPALRPGEPDVRLHWLLGDLFGPALDWLRKGLNDEVKSQLVGVLNPNLLKNALPGEVRDLDPVFTRAGFFRNASSLALDLEMNVPFDDKTLAVVLTALLTHKG